jgi:hypothetical protein
MLKLAQGLLSGINLADRKQDYLEKMAQDFVDLSTNAMSNITADLKKDDQSLQ